MLCDSIFCFMYSSFSFSRITLERPIIFRFKIYSITKNDINIVDSQINNIEKKSKNLKINVNKIGYSFVDIGSNLIICEEAKIMKGLYISSIIFLIKSVVVIPIAKPHAATRT